MSWKYFPIDEKRNWDYNREKLDGEVYYRILCFLAWESHKTGGILWYVGGWTSRCCGNGSGENICEKRVDEEVLWLFIASFLIIEFEKISVWGAKSWYNQNEE